MFVLKVRCWEVQQNGTVIPKAMQTHAGPVLDVAWSDVSRQFPSSSRSKLTIITPIKHIGTRSLLNIYIQLFSPTVTHFGDIM